MLFRIHHHLLFDQRITYFETVSSKSKVKLLILSNQSDYLFTVVNLVMDEPIFDPFLNVRKGGPKEKRIRRVELMGEHSPKPIYYIKVSQSMEDDFIDDEIFYDYFSEK